jgi:hypothetical protein
MSALGQKQTFAVHQVMSGLPPIATSIAYARYAAPATVHLLYLGRRPYISGMVMRSLGRGRPLNAPAAFIHPCQPIGDKSRHFCASCSNCFRSWRRIFKPFPHAPIRAKAFLPNTKELDYHLVGPP